MKEMVIEKAKKEDAPYIEEKLKKYLLDSENASWEQFFVAREDNKAVAFARIKDYGEYFELASLGVDYYHRKKGIGTKMLLFLIEEAKRLDSKKPLYSVTHRPNFVVRVGFKEIPKGPEALEYKRHHRTVLGPEKNKIVLLKA